MLVQASERARSEPARPASPDPRAPAAEPAAKISVSGLNFYYGLHRVLDTVCDTHEIDERQGAAWVELTKRFA